jgi:histidyl-tRNA synthetase
MIYEHEIPKGSKLYFGDSAKLKREIENSAVKVFKEFGYEEIVTPVFSYHQANSISPKELIRVGDEKNRLLSLRADSTLDVVRLITKRLGRATEHKKWFYLQPVFRYPSSEIYQVGAEYIGSSDMSEPIEISGKFFDKIGLKPILQISNIKIPHIISKELDIPLDFFEKSNIEKILNLDIKWLGKLAYLQTKEDINEVIEIAPESLKVELNKIKKLCEDIKYEDIIIAPLYYAKMRYYDDLYFRFFIGNKTVAMGGSYTWENLKAVGFAGYLDEIIELKEEI